MHPNDIRAAEVAGSSEEVRSEVEILESSGKVLGCVLCKEIVKRLDQFLTSPTFMENASYY